MVVIAAIIGTLLYRSGSWSAASSAYAQPRSAFGPALHAEPRPGATSSEPLRSDRARPTTEDDAAVTEEDGVLPDGVTVFDGEYPGVANLDADLLKALREAATDAADDHIEFDVKSGWRSRAFQDRLLRDAVSRYGSEKDAARWVATPETSPHVSGDAVDIGSVDAATWLSKHGAEYGLCQIYRNEPWHYELRAFANKRGCPRMYADPTRDPRMR